jgi:hypothetical protein
VKPSAPKAGDKKSTKKETPKKHSSRDDGPSDSDAESSDNDSSDGDSDSSLDVPNSSAATTTVPNAAGVVTFRPYVNSSTLEDFNEHASLIARRRWYKRFLNMAVQGGWTNESKVYELKIKMSPAVRNWRGQLRKSVRSDWKRLEKAFKREYCKSKVDDLERYYTMSQYKDETPLAFLYRLNLGAEHAGVRFRKSDRSRDQHVRRFLKNLHDDQLKLTLQTQRFRKVSDLEYVLKQQEEVRDGGRQNRAPQARDFRADNVFGIAISPSAMIARMWPKTTKLKAWRWMNILKRLLTSRMTKSRASRMVTLFAIP